MTAWVVLRIAAREVLRHRRRTLLVGSAIAFGAAVLVVHGDFVSGIERQLVTNLLIDPTGHVQVRAARDPATARESDFGSSAMIEDPAAVESIIRSTLPAKSIASRIASMGMILGDGTSSTRVVLVGVGADPSAPMMRALRGRLGAGSGDLDDGSVYLGVRLAERLRATAGATVTLTVPKAEGSYGAADVRVAGIVGRGAPWQDYFAYLPLPDLQRLLGAGSGVQEIGVTLDEAGPSPDAAKAALAGALVASRPELRVMTYQESGRFFMGIISATNIQMQILDIVLLLAVGLGIANTRILAVHERRGEIGVMTALGTPKSVVLGLFMAEGILLGLVFGALGALLGTAVALSLAQTGVALPAEAFRWMVGADRLLPHVGWASVLRAVAESVLVAALAGLYPAWRAALADPARAVAEATP